LTPQGSLKFFDEYQLFLNMPIFNLRIREARLFEIGKREIKFKSEKDWR